MEAFGKYQIIRRLGAGGMAEVFLAREPLAGGLTKTLVIKKIHSGLAQAPQFRAMFEDEAKICILLNHPNIVQTFNYGQIAHTFFLAMERVEGIDLLRLIHAAANLRRTIPPGLAAYIGQQIAKGLDYAHRKSDDYGEPLNIVHRDISPQNILVSLDGAVKIVDFGIARVRGQKNDEGVVKGKYAYMSPEQAMGKVVDRRSDIFSTGIVLYEVATGLALFGRLSERQALDAIKNAQVPRPRDAVPDMPEELERIIFKALARRPEDRYQTARDLQQDLGKFFFQLGSQEGGVYESGTLAAFIAQVVPQAERAKIRSLDLPEEGRRPPQARGGGPEPSATDVVEPGDSPSELQPSGTAVSNVGAPSEQPLVTGPRERKNVVVVEGVLGGLPALRRQLGEARARSALLDFLRVAEHVAYKHHAHPDRLDERGFTYLVGLPVAAEDDPTTAVQLALALVEALDGISRDLRPQLQLSIGVERGVAQVGRSVAPGDSRFEYELVAPVERIARRLSAEAMPGETLVGGGVFRATRGEWRYEELEPIELRPEEGAPAAATTPGPRDTGELERVRVFRVLGARPRSERMAPGKAEGGATLWGRELELQALEDAARDVVARGAGRFVLMVGDRGVGKRSLLAAFRARLDPATHRVLRAVASPTRRDVPYALIADIAHDLLGIPDDAEPREIKRHIDAVVAQVFDASDREEAKHARLAVDALSLLLDVKVPGADELDPAERRHRLYQTVRVVGARLARSKTLAILVEDIHNADAQSFDVFHALARDPLTRPVLIVATARRELRDGEDRVDALANMPSVTSIIVGELGPRARAQLVASRFERPDDPDVARVAQAILDRAGGNPFYVNEIFESLAERGILAPTGEGGRFALQRPDAEVAVPLGVEAVIGSRLDLLSDEDRGALRAASVLGRSFRAADLAAVVARDVEPLLDRLVKRWLLDAAGAGVYAFKNAITQEVAYGGLAAETRAELHRKAAERLAASPAYRRGADDAFIAQHLEAAGDATAAARAFARAGYHARDVSGNAEAYKHFSAALRLLPQDPSLRAERFDLHAEREQILRAWGKRSAQLREVTAMRRLAEEMGDGRRLALSLARSSALFLDAGKHAAARREIARALETARAAGDAVCEAEAHRLDANLLMNIGSYDEALERTRAALASLGNLQDRAALLERAQTLHALGNIQFDTGRGRDAERAYAESLVIYRRLGIRRLEASALNNLGNVSVGLGEYEEAIVHYKHSLKIDQDIGDRVGIGATLGNIGQTYGLLGDHDRARRYLAKALELDESSGDMNGLTDATIALGQIHLRRRDPTAAAPLLERGLELAQETRSRYQEIRALVYLALCKLDAGEPPEAPLDLARSAVKLAREAHVANGLVFGLCASALALRRAGRLDEAMAAAAEAIGVVEGGRSVDEVEEVFHHHARIALAAGQKEAARASMARAAKEVRSKAERLRDEAWRKLYLASSPAADILDGARAMGIE